jgi:hypothetical protein
MDPALAALDFAKAGAIIADMVVSCLAAGASPGEKRWGAVANTIRFRIYTPYRGGGTIPCSRTRADASGWRRKVFRSAVTP